MNPSAVTLAAVDVGKARGAHVDALGRWPKAGPDIRLTHPECAELVGADEELADAAAAARPLGVAAARAIGELPHLPRPDQPREPITRLRRALAMKDPRGEIVSQRVEQRRVAGGGRKVGHALRA